ncbi:AlpA family phage regulatory protein [Burkholderia sp. MSMB1589WGS]|uniref:helix-turn-helix transcriptional regulator n=1 Tax=Burkholderia sp. MSMB1589WGS TaxID=1636425 RepID=UPI0007B9ED84|nr:AlpA family phage regulatory protein [Burkholderia sp. MSMB1589WGS]
MKAIGIEKLVDKVDLGRSTIYRMIAEGKFPKPFQILPNRNAWIESDIDAWLAEKAGKTLPIIPQTEQEPEPA